MQCRSNCGACCIAPSIVEPFYGMPDGKPAGVRCKHLQADLRCALFGREERPLICEQFRPTVELCGQSQQEALQRLTVLEETTANNRSI